MKVKIGDTTYDSDDQPIMVILTSTERRQIANMDPGAEKYCCYCSKSYSESEIEDWMEEI